MLGAFEMECPVDFDGNLLLLAEKIDLHVAVRPERNVEAPVQRKEPLRLRKPVDEPEEELLCRASRNPFALRSRQRRMDKQVRRLRIRSVTADAPDRICERSVLAERNRYLDSLGPAVQRVVRHHHVVSDVAVSTRTPVEHLRTHRDALP